MRLHIFDGRDSTDGHLAGIQSNRWRVGLDAPIAMRANAAAFEWISRLLGADLLQGAVLGSALCR